MSKIISWFADLIIPSWVPYVACFAVGIVIAGVGQQWRLGAKISAMEASAAQNSALQANAALADLKTASDLIHKKASELSAIEIVLDKRFAELKKEFKNERASNPLPVDCKPTTIRLRSLQSAVSATNQAAAGQ